MTFSTVPGFSFVTVGIPLRERGGGAKPKGKKRRVSVGSASGHVKSVHVPCKKDKFLYRVPVGRVPSTTSSLQVSRRGMPRLLVLAVLLLLTHASAWSVKPDMALEVSEQKAGCTLQCDESCDKPCDGCTKGCNQDCDSSCDDSCDDGKCDASCDDHCNSECDRDCSNNCDRSCDQKCDGSIEGCSVKGMP